MGGMTREAQVPATARVAALPALVKQAAAALEGAQTHAEVLEARDMASVAYQAAKAAGRMAKAKEAHDALLAAVYRAQGHALLIESRAKMRLAEEYDAAQPPGVAAKRGGDRKSKGRTPPLIRPDDVGGKDALKDARRIRDAEQAAPGAVASAIDGMVDAGEEPTKAKLRRQLRGDAPAPPPDGPPPGAIPPRFAAREGETLDDTAMWRATEGLANLLLNGFVDKWNAGQDPPDDDMLWAMHAIKARGGEIGSAVARAAIFFRQLDEVVNGQDA